MCHELRNSLNDQENILRKTQMSKYRLLINLDLEFTDGDTLEEAAAEKKRIVKLMKSLEETTPSIVHMQSSLKARRGPRTGDISRMKFRTN